MGRLQIKRSNQLNEQGKAKPPLASNTEYGELAVNYNAVDPVLFIKDSNNKIIRIADKVTEESELVEAVHKMQRSIVAIQDKVDKLWEMVNDK